MGHQAGQRRTARCPCGRIGSPWSCRPAPGPNKLGRRRKWVADGSAVVPCRKCHGQFPLLPAGYPLIGLRGLRNVSNRARDHACSGAPLIPPASSRNGESAGRDVVVLVAITPSIRCSAAKLARGVIARGRPRDPAFPDDPKGVDRDRMRELGRHREQEESEEFI